MAKRFAPLLTVLFLITVTSCSNVWPFWPFNGSNGKNAQSLQSDAQKIPPDLARFDFVGQATFARCEYVALDSGERIDENKVGGVWRTTVKSFILIQGVDLGGSRPRSIVYIYNIEPPGVIKPNQRVYVYGFFGKSDGRLWGSCRSYGR